MSGSSPGAVVWWNKEKFSPDLLAELHDEHGNVFACKGATDPFRLDPGQKLDAWLLFDRPPATSKRLTLVARDPLLGLAGQTPLD